MLTKQLSVFIENRHGRLGEVLNVLKENKVNILSLSLADTMLTDVIVLKIEHEAGSLQSLLTMLSNNGINVEYMYGLSIDGADAYVVLKASDMQKTDEFLTKNNVKMLSTEEISKL